MLYLISKCPSKFISEYFQAMSNMHAICRRTLEEYFAGSNIASKSMSYPFKHLLPRAQNCKGDIFVKNSSTIQYCKFPVNASDRSNKRRRCRQNKRIYLSGNATTKYLGKQLHWEGLVSNRAVKYGLCSLNFCLKNTLEVHRRQLFPISRRQAEENRWLICHVPDALRETVCYNINVWVKPVSSFFIPSERYFIFLRLD